MKKKTQTDAVIEVMEKNGGYSSLKQLYQDARGIEGVEWKTKTPFASIRRIVQNNKYFFKIKPGLWALNNYRKNLPANIISLLDEEKSASQKKDYTHYYYQGLIGEIGLLRGFKVYIPPQDRNKPFLNQTLKNINQVETFPSFTYSNILNNVKSIDVMWFNKRGFPNSVFEIEYTTNFKNSLTKFHELTDFNTRLIFISDRLKRGKLETLYQWSIYESLKGRVEFFNYDTVADIHSNPYPYTRVKPPF